MTKFEENKIEPTCLANAICPFGSLKLIGGIFYMFETMREMNKCDHQLLKSMIQEFEEQYL